VVVVVVLCVVELCEPVADEELGLADWSLCGIELVPLAPAAPEVPAAAPAPAAPAPELAPCVLQLAETSFTLSTRNVLSPVAWPLIETVAF
jgi:hypothetical protein